ncbi:MAG: A24 family peptidase, partial [Chloroflexota bacterium]|nr:A24 family peptidase [Chloroflexota bacterium]
MPSETLLTVRAVFVGGYLAILVIDLRTRRIPNLITYPLLLVSLLARPDGIGPAPLANLVAAAVAFVVFVLFAMRGWMGMGDAKLAALIALASGPALATMALWGAFVAGGLAGV